MQVLMTAPLPLSPQVGNLSFPPRGDGQFDAQRPYSEEKAEQVDEEVRNLVNAAYERTTELLVSKKDLAAQLAQLLLQKEVIHRDDVEGVLGKRLWKEATTFAELAAGTGNSNPEEADVEPSSSAAAMVAGELDKKLHL